MFKKDMKTSVAALFMVLVMALSVVTFAPADTKAATTMGKVVFEMNEYDEAALSWEEVTGATKYIVYRADSRFAQYTKIAETTDTEYVDEDFEMGQYYKVEAVKDGGNSTSDPISYEIATFGESTYIFDSTDSKDSIQNVIDTAYKTSEAGQFDSRRFAFMFKPSTQKYDVKAKVGFYTQVAGMGISPEDTTIEQIECKAEWMKGRKYDGGINYSALCNFWRAVENLSTPATDTIWAVSQATAMRKMNFTGSSKVVRYRDQNKNSVSYTDPNYAWLYLHQEGGYASGGFLADSKISTMVSSGSQQQWLSRNVESGVNKHAPTDTDYQSAVWNNVLIGSKTSIKESNWPQGNDTVVDKTPIIAEKPFLAYDDDTEEYGVVVPAPKKDTQGVDWDEDGYDYDFIDMDDYIAVNPSMTAKQINDVIASENSKAVIFTPGIYNLDEEIVIPASVDVVMGLGYATLKPTNGNRAMMVEDSDNTRLAGLLFDAGRKESETLLTVGAKGVTATHAENPIVLSDCFFRVGGADATPCKVKTCVEINSNDVVCDNFWVWRADHGAGVGWDKNTAETGVVFNGQNITAYGLMVEHFQKNQTVWNADGGRCYMYQSELPYDITSQNVWNQPGSYGYTDYVVSDNVKTHEGYGIGIYSCYQRAQCYCESAIKCPAAPGVKFTNALSYSLVGNGTIDHVINKEGYGVMASGDMARLVSFVNGKGNTGMKDTQARRVIYKAKYDYDIPNKVYTGKAITPINESEINYGGVKLRKGIDYNLTYSNNTEIGTATVKIVGLGMFRDEDSFTFKIVPGKAKIKSVKGTKKKIKVKFGKVLGAKKYEVAYANKANFKGKKVKTTSKLKVTLKRKNKKVVYVKVRAFKKVGKTKYYGSYSKKKKVKKVK